MKKRASQRLVPRVRPPLLVLLLVLLVLARIPPACRRPLLSLSECMRVATVTRPFIVIHHPIMSCCISRARTGRLGVVLLLLLLQTMHINGHQRRDRTEVLRARGSAAAVPAIHKIVRPLTMYRRRLRGRRGGRNDVHAHPYMIVPAVEGLPHHYRQTLRVVAIHTLVPMHLMLILFGLLLLLLLLLMFMTARFLCRSRCRCRRQQGRHRQRRVRHQL